MQRLRRTVHSRAQGAVAVGEVFQIVGELRRVPTEFRERYNQRWIVQRWGYLMLA
jgi:hypothetical protein